MSETGSDSPSAARSSEAAEGGDRAPAAGEAAASQGDAARPAVRRVLFLSEKLTGTGISGHTLDLIRGLASIGVQTGLLAPQATIHEPLASVGCKPCVMPGCLWGKWLPFTYRGALAFAREFQPQLLHAQSAFASRLAHNLSDSLGLPYVVTCHHHLYVGQLHIKGRCKAVIAVGQVIRENLVNDVRVPKDLIHVIPAGIDMSRFGRHRTRPEGIPVVAAIGTLSKRKAFHHFVEAARLLVDRGVRAEFLIVGEGPEERRLRKLVADLKLSQCVTFYTYPLDVSTVMAEADVVVHPSLQEGFGLGVLEALAAGVPVVAAGVGGIYDVLRDKETGYIVPAADPLAIADRVHELIQDKELRLRLGAAGRRLVETEFTVEKMVEDTLCLYSQAIG